MYNTIHEINTTTSIHLTNIVVVVVVVVVVKLNAFLYIYSDIITIFAHFNMLCHCT